MPFSCSVVPSVLRQRKSAAGSIVACDVSFDEMATVLSYVNLADGYTPPASSGSGSKNLATSEGRRQAGKGGGKGEKPWTQRLPPLATVEHTQQHQHRKTRGKGRSCRRSVWQSVVMVVSCVLRSIFFVSPTIAIFVWCRNLLLYL